MTTEHPVLGSESATQGIYPYLESTCDQPLSITGWAKPSFNNDITICNVEEEINPKIDFWVMEGLIM